jgi:hypothetical protein
MTGERVGQGGRHMTSLASRATRILLAGATLGVAATAGAATIETPIRGLKLILIDKYTVSSKTRAIYLAKGHTISAPGPGPAAVDDPAGLTGSVEIIDLAAPTNRAVYDLPAPWIKNTGRVARYVNKVASAGDRGVEIALIRERRRLKVSAKNFGDGDSESFGSSPKSVPA